MYENVNDLPDALRRLEAGEQPTEKDLENYRKWLAELLEHRLRTLI